MKSVKPPSTRKGALAFLRGYDEANEGSETVAQMRVSLPTLPHLYERLSRRSRRDNHRYVRELDTGEIGALLRQLRDDVRVEIDATSSTRD